jgi:hypothetical protein
MKQKAFSTVSTRPITILITDYQSELLGALCTLHGLPGTPRARMAATAFTRGLNHLADELHITLPPATTERR